MTTCRLFVILLLCLAAVIRRTESRKIVCAGTSNRLSHSGNAAYRYRRLQQQYTNCTHIRGNLEIDWLDDPTLRYDLSFLNTIEEVTGYVLIAFNYAEVVDLSSLRIIRGETLFTLPKQGPYALMVTENWESDSQQIGLKQLWLPNLKAILRGNVQMFNNPLLCYAKHILWQDILQTPDQRVSYYIESQYRDFRTIYCPACDYACPVYDGLPRCWGPGPQLCQKLHRELCSPMCGDRNCYGYEDSQCCHVECSGGCSGPTNRDCTTCKNVMDDGACVARCPPRVVYHPNELIFQPNPTGKFQLGRTCVAECPVHLVRNGDICVKACPAGMMEQGGDCMPCENGVCKEKRELTCTPSGGKTYNNFHICQNCPGNDMWSFVTSDNIEEYKDCVIVENNLRILYTTFMRDEYKNIGPLNASKLEYLSSIREVRGFITIQIPDTMKDEVEDLSFLRNLEVIRGRQLYQFMRRGAALFIARSPMRKLNLRKLREIDNGDVYMYENPRLCYVHTVNWDRILKGTDQIMDTNVSEEKCRSKGKQCHKECDGCWGPGRDQCQRCQNFQIKDSCVDSCLRAKNYYPLAGKFQCAQCDWRCKNGCNGPTKKDCLPRAPRSDNETIDKAAKTRTMDSKQKENRNQVVTKDDNTKN